MKRQYIQTIIFSLLVIILITLSCQKLDPVAVTKFCPLENASAVSYNSAIVKGEFMDVGDEVSSYGHCWSTTSNPTIQNFKTSFPGKPKKQVEFTSELKGLTGGTKYYVRTYASSSSGTFYGKESSFTTDAATVQDVDGNTYNFIDIGTQTWMKENLKATKYKDNTSISYPGTDNTAWANNTTGAYAWYNNDAATYKGTYGALYNWYAVNTGKLCPTGWHVPSDTEWKTLEMYLGMSQATADLTGGRGTNEGSKLAGDASLWLDGVLEGVAEFGSSSFMAFPGGNRTSDGIYDYFGRSGSFWSSSEIDATNAWFRRVNNGYNTVYRNNKIKGTGLSIRCLKD